MRARRALPVRVHRWLLDRCGGALDEGARESASLDFEQLWQEAAGGRARVRILYSELSSLLSTWRRDRRFLASEAWEADGAAPRRRVAAPAASSFTGRGLALVHAVARAARLGVRQLVRERGFTATCSAFLGLAILVPTAGFTLLNAALLRPDPHVRVPERLVRIYTSSFRGEPYGPTSYRDMVDIREGTGSFSGVVGSSGSDALVRVGAEAPRPRTARRVTGEFFEVLGIPLLLGRAISTEDVESGERVVVLGHDFWQREFGGEDALGRTLEIDGKDHVVIGVAPPGVLALGEPLIVDMWLPLRPSWVERRGTAGMIPVARLSPGATLEQAAAELGGVAGYLRENYPEIWRDELGRDRYFTALAMQAARLPPEGRAEFALVLGLAAVLVGLLVTAICANVGTLFAVRAMRQRAEIATRLAIGAPRSSVVLELAVQGILLAALGAVLGLAATYWLAAGFAAGSDSWLGLPVAVDLNPDARVIAFVVILVGVLGTALSLVPALRASDIELASEMKGRSAGGGGTSFSRRAFLLSTQVATSIALLVGAAVVARGVATLQATDLGFEPDGVVVTEIDLSFRDYETAEMLALVEALTTGGDAAGGELAIARTMPLGGVTLQTTMEIEGYEPPPGQVTLVPMNIVTPGYFRVMGIRLVAGRAFTSEDRQGAPGVLVVNAAFVRAYDLPANPLGLDIELDGDRAEIVGVVADSKQQSVAERDLPFVWRPYAQNPTSRLLVHRRGSEPAAAALAMVRDRIYEVDDELALISARRLGEVVDDATLGERLLSAGLGAASVLALMLAALGVYGSVSALVGQRSHEFGVRMAVGAVRGSILRLVLREGLALVALGCGLGAVLAIGLGQLLRAAIAGLGSFDPLSLLGGIVALAAVALVASVVPAMRASRLDPARTLHAE